MAKTWTVGSSPGLDLVVDSQVVSGKHCRLTSVEGGYLLEDLASTNGTFVNGFRVKGETFVTRRDVVTLGLSQPFLWPIEEPPAPSSRVVSIGREADNDIVVNLTTVSGRHARVTWNGVPGEALIEDLGSANGTSVGSPDRKVSKSLIRTGDTVFLGSHPLPAGEILARLERGPLPTVSVGDVPLVLGRNPGCGLVIDSPAVSGRHARLSRKGNGFVIEDLGSSNGTFVNGARINIPMPVNPGDAIGLGSYSLTLARDAPAAAGLVGVSRRVATGLTADTPAIAPPALPGALSAPSPPPLPSSSFFSPVVFLNEFLRLGRPAWRPGILLVQAVGVAVGVAVALPELTTRMFALSLAAVWFGIANALIGCPARDSKAVGLDRHVARVFGLGLICVLQCLLAWGIVTFGKGPVADGAAAVGLLVMTSLVGLVLGLAVVEAMPRRAFAWLAVPALLIPMVWLGGERPVFSGLPPGLKSAAGAVPTRWAFEGLLLLADVGQGDVAERFFPADSDRMGVTADLIALGAMLLGLAAAGAFISAGRRTAFAGA